MNYEGDSRLQHIHVDLQAGPLLPAGRHKPRTASFGWAKSHQDREIAKWKFLFRSEKRTIYRRREALTCRSNCCQAFFERLSQDLSCARANFWFKSCVEAEPICLDNEGGARRSARIDVESSDKFLINCRHVLGRCPRRPVHLDSFLWYVWVYTSGRPSSCCWRPGSLAR